MNWKNFRKYIKPLALITYGLFLGVSTFLSNKNIVPNFVAIFSSNIPLLILFWLYDYGIQDNIDNQEIKNSINNIQSTINYNKQDLDENLKNYFQILNTEIDNNEKCLEQLFNTFSEYVTEKKVDDHLRIIITKYRKIATRNIAIKKGVEQQIKIAKDTVTTEEYLIDFNAILDYPEPYYKNCDGEIVATNIGSISEGFYKRIKKHISDLIKLNEIALENNKNNEQFKIRRVFICDIEDITDDLEELVNRLIKINVEVKCILRRDAEEYARTYYNTRISKLEDFTVFKQKEGDISYSGRLEGENLLDIKKSKKMRISTNKDTIADLIRQFDVLWDRAILCNKGSDLREHIR